MDLVPYVFPEFPEFPEFLGWGEFEEVPVFPEFWSTPHCSSASLIARKAVPCCTALASPLASCDAVNGLLWVSDW